MKKVNLYYYNAIMNFGDQLNELIFRELFNVCAFSSTMKEAECVAIGSVLQGFLCKKNAGVATRIKERLKMLLLPPVKVFGTGFMGEAGFGDYEENFHRKMEFYTLRGKLTQHRIENIEQKKMDITLGDPGLLLSKIVDRDTIEKKIKYGIVPHFLDTNNPSIKMLEEILPHSCVIDVKENVLKTAHNIAECEFIISTAMHGLIAADSFGIPNLWVKVSDNVVGDGYKFRDYYSVFDLDAPVCIDMRQDLLIEKEIVAQLADYKIDFRKVEDIQKNLIQNFPYVSSPNKANCE